MTVNLPLNTRRIRQLKLGEEVFLNGVLYSARDQAHQKMANLLRKGSPLPLDLNGQVIFYMGPSPTPPGAVIGSCGPTTASRMDAFTPELFKQGLAGTIGKGPRSNEVIEAIREYHSIYFYAYGGCGALYASRVKSIESYAFRELGPEAVYKLEVFNFPVIVAIDCLGRSIFV